MPVFPQVVFPDADIVLLSSEGMRFHLNKQVLRDVSQFYRSMFAIPPPIDNSKDEEKKLKTVDTGLKSAVLSYLLQFIYGYNLSDAVTTTPNAGILRTIDDVLPLIQAAQKLQFDGVEAKLTQVLASLLKFEPHPLRAWAIAKKYGFVEEEKAAAVRYCNSVENYSSDWSTLPELGHIAAKDFNALLQNRQDTIRRFRSEALEKLWGPFECAHCEIVYLDAQESGWEVEYTSRLEALKSGKSELRNILEPLHPLSPEASSPFIMRYVVELTNCDECKAHAKARAASFERYRPMWLEGELGIRKHGESTVSRYPRLQRKIMECFLLSNFLVPKNSKGPKVLW